MSRTNWVLAAALLLQLGLAAWLLRPAEARGPAPPLVGDLAADDVTGVEIRDSAAAVLLARTAAGWTLPAADDYRAQPAGITQLISDVLAIDTSRLVASTQASHVRLRVDPNSYVRRIELRRAAGAPVVLYVGSSPGANATHVRLEGQDAVYLAPGALAGAAASDLGAWIDPLYITVDPGAIRGLEIFNANGRFSLRKDAAGAWVLDDQAAGETVDQARAETLANQLANLQLVRPLGKRKLPAYDLDTPQATATLTLSGTQEAGQTITLDIGALDERAGVYTVKSSASEYYAEVSQYALQEIVEQARAGLIAGE